MKYNNSNISISTLLCVTLVVVFVLLYINTGLWYMLFGISFFVCISIFSMIRQMYLGVYNNDVENRCICQNYCVCNLDIFFSTREHVASDVYRFILLNDRVINSIIVYDSLGNEYSSIPYSIVNDNTVLLVDYTFCAEMIDLVIYIT